MNRTVPLIVPPHAVPPATTHHAARQRRTKTDLAAFGLTGYTEHRCIVLSLRWLHGHGLSGLQGAGSMKMGHAAPSLAYCTGGVKNYKDRLDSPRMRAQNLATLPAKGDLLR